MSAAVETADGAIVVLFDQIVSEAHEQTSEATEQPVERGADITDHVITKPRSFTLELFVTNTPISDIEGRGQEATFDLKVPKYEPPFDGTPGAVFREAGKAIGAVLDGIFGEPKDNKATLYAYPEPFDRIREVQEALGAIQESAALCNVSTLSRDYEDVVLIRVSLPRSQKGGASFALDFREIRTVASASVKAPEPLEKRGKPKVNKGSQGTKEASAQKKQSVAYMFKEIGYEKIRGFFGP